MTPDSARKWLVLSSLSITATLLLFFLVAPALGYPLVFAQSLRVLEILLPVFLGYLGSAATFVFRSGASVDVATFRPAAAPLAAPLILGPLTIFALSLLALLVTFGMTNRPAAAPGSGISVDQLSAGVSVILGLLAVTTNVAIGYLFGGGHDAQTTQRNIPDPDRAPTDDVRRGNAG